MRKNWKCFAECCQWSLCCNSGAADNPTGIPASVPSSFCEPADSPRQKGAGLSLRNIEVSGGNSLRWTWLPGKAADIRGLWAFVPAPRC